MRASRLSSVVIFCLLTIIYRRSSTGKPKQGNQIDSRGVSQAGKQRGGCGMDEAGLNWQGEFCCKVLYDPDLLAGCNCPLWKYTHDLTAPPKPINFHGEGFAINIFVAEELDGCCDGMQRTVVARLKALITGKFRFRFGTQINS